MAVLRCGVATKAFLCCVNLPLKIEFPIPDHGILNYRDPVFLIGSCFSEEIGARFEVNLFDVLQNPNGILYNPNSIATALRRILRKEHYTSADLFHRNELFHTWDHHGSFSGTNERETLGRINNSIDRSHEFLAQSGLHLFITFASMRVYTYEGRVVANCHKYPASAFGRELLEIEGEFTNWLNLLEELFDYNPELHVWFTLSPVRHIRDGIMENARSKARTLELVHMLCDRSSPCRYFPAYEIIIDELRDYRYFDRDMVHPNDLAVDYVWNRFLEVIPDAESKLFFKEFGRLKALLNHRILHAGTRAHHDFEALREKELVSFTKKYGKNPSLD